MHWTVTASLLVMLILQTVYSKPVVQKRGPPTPAAVEGGSEDDGQGTDLSYDHYLRQVVMALEEDPEFRKKLEESNVSDIKDGTVAKHIEMVSHNIRTKLDEIKRREIFRLQELRRLQMKTMQGTKVLHYIAYHGGVGNVDIPAHLDIANPHSFEMKDLEKLIKQTTSDLEELDKQRKQEFKEYEMEKEFEKRDKLSHMTEEQRKEEEAKMEELKKKHADHPKVHHPGSKDQFEEVWDKKDHLEDQEFNPKTFFNLHDIEGDGYWGIEEVEAVLQSELDKVYDGKNPEDDPMERFEEMNRMREHIFTEMDQDRDARISLDEFLGYTGKQGENEEFKKDEGWKTLDEEDLFTDDEYQKFLAEHHAQPGEIPPPGNMGDPNVQHMQMNQGQGQMPQGHDQNLQFQPHAQQQQQGFQQQQNQFAQQQQMLQHQQQQFMQQQAAQQQLAQQHAQMQQQHQQQQQQVLHQQQQQMGQPVQQQGQGQPVQGQGQPVQGQGQPVLGQTVQQQGQPVQGQVPVQNQQQHQQQVPVQQQQQQQQQVPVQQQQQQQQQTGQVPVQNQQAQVPVQQQAQGQQQGQVPAQNQQQQGQPAQ